MSAAETNEPAAQQSDIGRASGAHTGGNPHPHEIARADSEHREAVRAVPSDYASQREAAVLENPIPTCSELFPLGEGTAEQVVSGLGHPSDRAVPGSREQVGTTEQLAFSGVTNQTSPDPSISTPRGFSPERSATTDRQTVAMPPTAQQIKQQVFAWQQPLSSWAQQQISEIVSGLLDGSLERPRPAVGGLWYAGRVNGLAGESGCGKSWTMLQSCAIELEKGEAVVYIDMEDSAIGIVQRLLDMGVPAEVIADPTRFVYVHPDEAFRDDVRTDLWGILDAVQPSLVVLDSTGESLAHEGIDPNADDGVTQWFQRVPRAIAERGPAVVLIDHLPKSDSSAKSPIGSQRKKAATDGVLLIQTVKSGMHFSKGRAGLAELTCVKDRNGHFTTGEKVMQLVVNPEPTRGEGGVEVSLVELNSDAEFAPTRCMSDISVLLEASSTPLSTTDVRKAVKTKRDTVIEALAVLVHSGYVSVTNGPRNAKLYALLKPYKIGDPYEVPDDLAGCGHPWHTGEKQCNPKWCHTGHHGNCNELAEQGYVLDADGEILQNPPELDARRDAVLAEIVKRPPVTGNDTAAPWGTGQ